MRTLLLVILLATLAGADELKLRGGRSVRGNILKETEEAYWVDLGFRVVMVPKKDVVARERGEKAAPELKTAVTKSKDSLYSTIKRSDMSVKENVTRTGGAVVMVQTPSGLGSGFIITSDGYVVTNDHVVQGETKITVVVFERGKDGTLDRRKLDKVKLVAINAYVDLALLKIEGVSGLSIVYLGDSGLLRQGQPVYAIGNPLGLERTVSEGIVSTTNRAFEGLTFIQTTTQINPGNSGGPLFNLSGQVVGVTNMGIPAGEGLNFAIPVNAVKRFLHDRDAFAYDKDNPNSGFRYLPPPAKSNKRSSTR
ncbi:MAG: trypsin-like peptidase domain-containing protein [Planctomycetota bacterium]|nr:trypsin-like peptidase domain-containing protein [Planctomycetota bacterium]